jgi:N utilization substance protein B
MTDTPQTAPNKPKSGKRTARSAARLAAVQALYQMEIAGTDAGRVIAEFATMRAEAGIEGAPEGVAIARADRAFFGELVRGVVRLQRTIDPEIDKQLASGWRLARLDSILRQILRAGVFELIDRTETPPRVVISEYIEIAKDFFDGDEPRVANGVLDRLARRFRAEDGSLRPDIAPAIVSELAEAKAEEAAEATGTPEGGRRTLHLPSKPAEGEAGD